MKKLYFSFLFRVLGVCLGMVIGEDERYHCQGSLAVELQIFVGGKRG